MRTLLLVVALLISTATYGKWDKETVKAFHKCEVVNLQVDFSSTTIMGLDLKDGAEYIGSKIGGSSQILDLLFKRFQNIVAERASSKKKIFEVDTEADFTFKVVIKNITEKAGMRGEAILYDNKNTNNIMKYNFKIDDGRWNSFENLFLEASQEMGKDIKTLLSQLNFGYSTKSFKIVK